jgi:hypothetical protein
MTYYFELAFFLGAGWGLAGFLRDLAVTGLNSILQFFVIRKARKMYDKAKQQGSADVQIPSFID